MARTQEIWRPARAEVARVMLIVPLKDCPPLIFSLFFRLTVAMMDVLTIPPYPMIRASTTTMAIYGYNQLRLLLIVGITDLLLGSTPTWQASRVSWLLNRSLLLSIEGHTRPQLLLRSPLPAAPIPAL